MLALSPIHCECIEEVQLLAHKFERYTTIAKQDCNMLEMTNIVISIQIKACANVFK
jgi:hypothetical protein